MEVCKTVPAIGLEGTGKETGLHAAAGGSSTEVYAPSANYAHTEDVGIGLTAKGPARATAPAPVNNPVLSAWIAADPASIRLAQEATSIAQTSSTVLVRGESGTGKELLSWMLHNLSPRAEQPCVKIDCASLPLELVESELFGYEKGAFTGATQAKPGRLELAGKGTVVLDEVAALTMPMQAKLLRVIEDRRFERLGGTRSLTVDARIIALTNVNLEQAVSRRTFREDLYYRLNVIPMVVPPLRQRRDDLAALAEHFFHQFASERSPRVR